MNMFYDVDGFRGFTKEDDVVRADARDKLAVKMLLNIEGVGSASKTDYMFRFQEKSGGGWTYPKKPALLLLFRDNMMRPELICFDDEKQRDDLYDAIKNYPAKAASPSAQT